MSDPPRNRPPVDDARVWSTRRTSFGSQADAYALGRPSYPADALRWVLPSDAHRVLDLAAGTGRLTEGLVALGLEVVAVEPLAEMRAYVASPAEAVDGTAEAIPLPDASVDAVTVGQAFHWFDVPRATAEIHRVLRAGGTVGLLWNMLDDTDPFVAVLADRLDAEERLSHLREDQEPPYVGVDGMSTPERRMFRHTVPYDADRLVAFVHSRSQTILLPAEARAALIDDVRELAPAGEFDLPLVCEAWRGERVS
jgi:SAM-dependent methyltransferase